MTFVANGLKKFRAIEARRLELEFFRKMGVYTKVPRSEAGDAKIISTKWIDTDKGDSEYPNYRSRLVGREMKADERPDLFAATPPLETFKFLLAKCAKNQQGPNPYRLATIDIKRAYFYAPALTRKL